MKHMLNPKWLVFINILPVTLLFFLFYSEYKVIQTLLEEENLTLWYNLGGALLILTILQLGYILYSIQQKKPLSIIYALTALVLYSAFLYIYSVYSGDIIPWRIPRWMISQDAILYPGTFIMPTLAHALFIVVVKITSKSKNNRAWLNFLFALAVPLLTFMFTQIVLPLWRPVNYKFEQHVLIIGCVIGVILFLFFLIRGFYIISLKRQKGYREVNVVLKVIFGIFLPILGLSINTNFDHIFGNFSSHWFYALAIINGLVLALSATKNKHKALLLYISRCITFSFTFYFFIVFLPFLPLSVIAIIALGSGFLMLTPLVLFVIHVQELSNNFKFLKQFYKKQVLVFCLVLGFLVIPSVLVTSFYKDRLVLHDTLDYVYNPDYSKDYQINKASLQKTLDVIKFNKTRNSGFLMNSQTPYLSSIFKWITLDNLTLSDAKIKTIEKIFFNSDPFKLRPERLRNHQVNISNISSNSVYNEEENVWTSWIDLEITNKNPNNFTSEYATTIDLPNGCWISDYYLYVGDRKEMGILAEKKSAMWIFSEIRNINRDPGLLHYLTGNKVSFRVFPFAKNEIRKTGIQFIHKEPVSIEIDGYNCTLGSPKPSIATSVQNNHVAYVSSKEKETLTPIKRKPYCHFIIDVSKGKDSLKSSYISTLNSFIKEKQINTEGAKISFSNTFSSTHPFTSEWANLLEEQTFEGGFFLERSIKKLLFNAYTHPTNTYPIIIVVTDNMLESVIHKNFANLSFTYPESSTFYHLNTLGRVAPHNLSITPNEQENDPVTINFDHTVLPWPNAEKPLAYLPNDTLPNIVLKTPYMTFNKNEEEASQWETGLLLQGKWFSDILHPETAEKDWNLSVYKSFDSKVMTPLTSYIVVENEAQKAALLRKQKEVLEGKKSLDLNENTQRMSEPNIFIMLIILVLAYAVLKRKRLLVVWNKF